MKRTEKTFVKVQVFIIQKVQTPTKIFNKVINIWAASWQNQQNDCAPSEDSDQPGHSPSLISVFAVRSMGN